MSEPQILYRRQMRLLVINALEKAGLMVGDEPVSIDSPGNWAVQEDGGDDSDTPCIFVRTGVESKASPVRAGQPQFNTSVDIQVKAIVSSTTAEDAQDDMELLWYRIENLLLTDYGIVSVIQCANAVDSQFDCTSAGQMHIASMAAIFRYECFEVFDRLSEPSDDDTDYQPPEPSPTVLLDEAIINFDLDNVADLTGTYPDSPFPEAVQPAPRTHGPDGRNEAVLKIPLG